MKLFGTDGIRGPVGADMMNQEIAKGLGRALAIFCRKRNLPARIIIARDTRESGPKLEEAVVAGVTSAGADAVIAGVIPTPALAYLVGEQKAGMGVVISASHNPFGDNGFKPFKNDGTKLKKEEEEEIEKYIIEKETGKENVADGKKIHLPDARERYAGFILKKMPAGLEKGKYKIVLDCANGATYEAAPAVFGEIAKELSLFSAAPDGKNINDNCGSQHPEALKKEVMGKHADLGLAFDGDGDRMIAVDEKGQALTGDQIIYIIAKMLKEKGQLKNDLVITTVMSNIGFIGDLKKMGIDHVATAVGDQPVFREMQKRGAVLGGEESGHIIYSDYHPAGDGIVGGVMLVAAMSHFKKPLSELAAEVTLFPKLLLNVRVKSKPELTTIPEITQAIKEVESKLGGEGRVLVRYSGTENLCRVMVEGKDAVEIEGYAEQIAQTIKNILS